MQDLASVGGELSRMERHLCLELLTNTIITVACHEGEKGLSNNQFTVSWLSQNTGAPVLCCNQESTRLCIKLHRVQLNFKLLRWFRCPLQLPELSLPFPLQFHIPYTTTSWTSCCSLLISSLISPKNIWRGKQNGGGGGDNMPPTQLCHLLRSPSRFSSIKSRL